MNNELKLICPPDISDRDLKVEIEQEMDLKPEQVYSAWTENFGTWFAKPGTLIMDPKVNSVFFFETEFEGKRHPHYGRFLSLISNKSIEMTWLNEAGTKGTETVLKVDIKSANKGVNVKLTHLGFPDRLSQTRHKEAWEKILRQFESTIKESKT